MNPNTLPNNYGPIQTQSPLADIWVSRPPSNTQAKLRLFCVPYAGSGVAVYHAWSALLPSYIELCLVNLPGREKRLRETPYHQLNLLVEALGEAFGDYLDKPLALFGHSMGALICFELARQLYQRYGVQPAHLFVSAHRAPHLPARYSDLHHLTHDEFISEIQQRYQGIPQIVLQDPELLALFLPVLRADFEMLETYTFHPSTTLACPISVFGGDSDPIATQAELAAWQDHTQSSYYLTTFPGDHFYLHHQRHHLIRQIVKDLAGFDTIAS